MAQGVGAEEPLLSGRPTHVGERSRFTQYRGLRRWCATATTVTLSPSSTKAIENANDSITQRRTCQRLRIRGQRGNARGVVRIEANCCRSPPGIGRQELGRARQSNWLLLGPQPRQPDGRTSRASLAAGRALVAQLAPNVPHGLIARDQSCFATSDLVDAALDLLGPSRLDFLIRVFELEAAQQDAGDFRSLLWRESKQRRNDFRLTHGDNYSVPAGRPPSTLGSRAGGCPGVRPLAGSASGALSAPRLRPAKRQDRARMKPRCRASTRARPCPVPT